MASNTREQSRGRKGTEIYKEAAAAEHKPTDRSAERETRKLLSARYQVLGQIIPIGYFRSRDCLCAIRYEFIPPFNVSLLG